MSDLRDYEYTYKDGGWFEDSEATLENTEESYSIHGRDADKFNDIANHYATSLEIEETGKDSPYVTIHDKNTGKTFSAIKNDTTPAIVYVLLLVFALICGIMTSDILPILVTTPAISLSMLHTLPWGPFLFAGMFLFCRWAVKRFDLRYIDNYKKVLLVFSLILMLVTTLLMRFVFKDPSVMDFSFNSLFNEFPAIACIGIAWFSIFNIFFLAAGITVRDAHVIRHAVFYQVLIPMAAMICSGVGCAMASLPMELSHTPQSPVLQDFLARLPYTQWYWLTDLLDKLIFSRKPLIVALIALVSGIVLAKVEELICFLKQRSERKKRRKQARQHQNK